MSRLAEVSPAMRHRLGGLVEQYQSVACDACRTEFVARRGADGKCPACGHLDAPAVAAVAAAVGNTIAASKTLDQYLDSTLVAFPFGKPVPPPQRSFP
jgi:ribosomal protein L37AE/L43A